MMLLGPRRDCAERLPNAEALIEEARRRQRRRRRVFACVLAGLLALGAAIAATIATIGGSPTRTASASPAHSGSGGLPAGPVLHLDVAGALAVGPTGALYVAAPLQHRILVRLADGKFRVVAGDGRRGFAGDGGPALDAELSSPSNLIFGPKGALYFVDGGRVRVIQPDGVIRTIAGNGVGANSYTGSASPPIASGTLALAASLGPSPSIALSPAGNLYLDTASQLLRLTGAGRLETLRARRASFPNSALPRPSTEASALLPSTVVATSTWPASTAGGSGA